MTNPLFRKVDCLSIPVPDLEAALAFYSGISGTSSSGAVATQRA